MRLGWHLATYVVNRISHVSVVTAEEIVHTRFVLLALGMGEQLLWPPWAARLREQGLMVNHVYDPGFRLKDIQAGGPIAVIGAGISGGQLAPHLTEKGFERSCWSQEKTTR
jgi:cation diffusion facilitator CzcD-associated flavoprotein CzcO